MDKGSGELKSIHGGWQYVYRLSPGLYHSLYRSKWTVANWIYILGNLGSVRSISVTPEISSEYEEVVGQIRESDKDPYPKNWAMDKKHGLILYNTVRNKRPGSVLETGVANGFSTRIILEALEKNGFGRLYSVDISNDVGKFANAASQKTKKRWKLIVNKGMIPLEKLVKEDIDIFIHDSDHSYKNMTQEFNFAYKRVKKGGLIMSDDTNSNTAFVDFCRARKVNFELYPSFRKTFGVAFV